MLNWLYKHRTLVIILVLLALSWQFGLAGPLLSEYRNVPVYRGAHVDSPIEAEEFKKEWIQYIIDNDCKWKAMLWIPDSGTGGFIEISWYERKTHWWVIW